MILIEIWFSILARQALRNANFTSVRQLRETMDAFIAEHNEGAAPSEWEKAAVRLSQPRQSYAELLN